MARTKPRSPALAPGSARTTNASGMCSTASPKVEIVVAEKSRRNGRSESGPRRSRSGVDTDAEPSRRHRTHLSERALLTEIGLRDRGPSRARVCRSRAGSSTGAGGVDRSVDGECASRAPRFRPERADIVAVRPPRSSRAVDRTDDVGSAMRTRAHPIRGQGLPPRRSDPSDRRFRGFGTHERIPGCTERSRDGRRSRASWSAP